jgi:hypothetical protein
LDWYLSVSHFPKLLRKPSRSSGIE